MPEIREPSPSANNMTYRLEALSGFTLIEMMVTLTLLAILALAVVPMAQLSAKRQNEAELREALRDIREAIDSWKSAADEGRIARTATESGYPATLSALVNGSEDLKNPGRRIVYFLRRIPRDPFADSATSPSQQWGLRSYASSAENPKPGDDVYDVYSQSTGTGLNGIPYRDW